MGEATEDIIEGLVCMWCGIYFERPHGYPVICKDCYESSSEEERDGLPKATELELCEGD